MRVSLAAPARIVGVALALAMCGLEPSLAAPTTTTLTSSDPNPSALGEIVTLKATVIAPNGGTPSGTVSFRNHGVELAQATLQPANLTQIALGNDFSCVLSSSKTVTCWGSGGEGQLGSGSTADSTTPQRVLGLSSVTAIAAGNSHVCAMKSDQTVACWGLNLHRQLGTGNNANATSPQAVTGLTDVTALALGYSQSCALKANQSVVCWGNGQDGLEEVPSLTGVVAIAAGSAHICALKNDQTVACWGDNSSGQLGTGSLITSATPQSVSGLSGATAITAGGSHTCAIKVDQTAVCWGGNFSGQLGTGDTRSALTPQTVSGLTGVISIAAGASHTCAIKSDATTACWGWSLYGQLGTGSTTSATTPQVLSGLSSAVAIDAGHGHTCALRSNHTSACWGRNARGQLGTGNTTNALVPQAVKGLPYGQATLTTTALPAGSLGLTARYLGATGFDASTSIPVGHFIQGLVPHVEVTSTNSPIAVGNDIYFIATVTGVGSRPTGTITFKNGSTTLATRALVASSSTPNTSMISYSTSALPLGDHTITVEYSGDSIFASAVSDPYLQQVKPGASVSLSRSANPTLFGQPVTFTATVTGSGATPTGIVTFKSDGAVLGSSPLEGNTARFTTALLGVQEHNIQALYSGDDNFAPAMAQSMMQEVNQASTTTSLTSSPSPSTDVQAVTFTATVTPVSPGGGMPIGNVTFKNGGTILGTGTLTGGTATFTAPAFPVGEYTITAEYPGSTGHGASVSVGLTQTVLTNITATALSSSANPSQAGQTVALRAKVVASSGLPPTGSVSFRDNDVEIGRAPLTIAGATKIASGGYHTCALKADQTVACWGNNHFGQLGIGNTIGQTAPQDVSGLADVVAIAAGQYHTCALRSDQTVSCWGVAEYGSLGMGTGNPTSSNVPVPVSSLSGITEIAAGTYQTCALKSDQTVACWGSNSRGQLGIGNNVDQATPQTVPGLTGVVALAAGSAHTCALKADQTVACWGSNSRGQLGTWDLFASNVPVPVPNLSGVTAIVAGGAHNCVLKVDLTAVCWGLSEDGVLGGASNGEFLTTVSGLTGATRLTAGERHTCALTTAGGVQCWGRNGDGQLGTGNLTNAHGPVPVSGLTSGAQAITAGIAHTCALMTTGGVQCWGWNGNGQLGTRNTTQAMTAQETFGILFGQASISTSVLSMGAHPLTATYEGDARLSASTSAILSQQVDAAATTTVLTSSANPSVFGQQVTFTATVTSGGGTPTGDVTFWDGGVGTGANLGTVALNGSGVATLAIATLSVASHAINAEYTGNASLSSSVASDLAQQVNQGATTIALVPSASSIVFGSGVTLTATVSVTAPAAGTPSGTVTFFDGATEIGSSTLGGGIATLTTSTLSGGAHSLTAVYGGDGNFIGATSAAASVTVTPAATTATVVTSPNPSKFGERVMLTATVTSAVGTPQGTVTFLLNGNAIATETLNGAGKRSVARSGLLSVGDHMISVVYNGNADYAGSTAIPVPHTVEKAETTTVLAPTTSPTLPGAPVTLAATVNVIAPGSSALAGRVRFKAGNRLLGIVDLSGSTATLTTSDIVTGDHVLTAEYLGNTRHNGSRSDDVVHAVDPRVGPEFRVNTHTARDQDLPAIAALGSGRSFVSVWQSTGQDGSAGGIYGRMISDFDSTGQPTFGTEFRVNTTTADNQAAPKVAALTDRGFVVTWQSRLQDGSAYGVFARRYDALGNAMGGEVQVNTTTIRSQFRPAISGRSDGGYIVVWQSYLQDGSSHGIYGRIFGADGNPIGDEFAVNSMTNGGQMFPAVTTSGNGGFVVVWSSNAEDGTPQGIYGQRFSSLGAKIGAQFKVNAQPAEALLLPQIQRLSGGELMTAWASKAADRTSWNIVGRRLAANSVPIGSETGLNSHTRGLQGQPTISAIPGGGFIVAWASYGQDGSDYGIVAQRFFVDGTTNDVAFPVNKTTAGRQWRPSVATLGTSAFLGTFFVVVWSSESQDKSGKGIYGQLLMAAPDP